MKILNSAYELLGILLFRFQPLPRAWMMILMLVNMASIFFLDTIYGKGVFAAMMLGFVIMIVIYNKRGFVRLLGIGHILWIPMLVWIFMNPPVVTESSGLSLWLSLLVVTNSISLVIDTLDVYRFIKGDRKSYYFWK